MATAAQIAEQYGFTECREGFTGFCPSCGYETGFSVVDKGGRTLFHCHAGGCTQQEIIKVLREDELWENPSSQAFEFPDDAPTPYPPPSREVSSAKAALAIWERSKPAPGTVVETYLRGRGYLGPIPPTLRYATGVHPSDQQWHPIMLAAAMLPGDPPETVGVHRTFLLEDGSGKALLTRISHRDECIGVLKEG
jgi:hypothetical protein